MPKTENYFNANCLDKESPRLVLRDYQDEAITAVAAAFRRGVRRQLIHLPTGTGKTIVFGSLIGRTRRRCLDLAHRDALIRQSIEKIRMIEPGVDVRVVKAGENEIDRRVVVASVQTICRPDRLATVPRDFSLAVIDECHHSAA